MTVTERMMNIANKKKHSRRSTSHAIKEYTSGNKKSIRRI